MIYLKEFTIHIFTVLFYTLQDLLKLWPSTENSNTKKLCVLLDDFILQSKNLEDAEVMLYGKDSHDSNT